MNFVNLKKYFFANLLAFWAYYITIIFVIYKFTKFEPSNVNIYPSASTAVFMYCCYCAFGLLYLAGFLIVEILIRKFIIDKKFQNFKLNIKIKFPKLVSILYKILFYIGIMLAGIYVLLLGIFMLFSLFD